MLLWAGIGTGMIFLLVAAIGQRNQERLRSYTIGVKGGTHGTFLTKENIEELLHQYTAGVQGELVSDFNLRGVESKIQQHPFIRKAQLYFDNQDVLHLSVQEKIPLARLYTNSGSSFYLDELGAPMPLSETKTVKLPVFTSLPDSVNLNKKDTLLLSQIKVAAQIIVADSFWSSQVSQLDLTSAGEWEMIPAVGDHVVKLGNLTQMEDKLRRIWVFYQQVVAKVGWSRYRSIDVRFDGQVVAGRGANPRVDSLELRRSVQQLLQQSRMIENDTVIRYLPKPFQPLLTDGVDTVSELKNTLPIDSAQFNTSTIKN
ncbi:MAG: cell division protein FtsQ/DivIB [Chitinophagaceae bacterium]